MSEPEYPTNETDPQVSQSRLHLIWDILVLQFKLALDGFRDVVLLPVSLFAAIGGLLFGGDQPAQYLQHVLRFGRRTETWINLFGHRRGEGTSDQLIQPLKEKFFHEAESNVWLQKTGSKLNKSLDSVDKAVNKSRFDKPKQENPDE
jgi:hypothetical protein